MGEAKYHDRELPGVAELRSTTRTLPQLAFEIGIYKRPSMKAPLLPNAPSWFPGHMSLFMKSLPTLLNRTDIILELRDARLPLTSINPNFERHLNNWKGKAKEDPNHISAHNKQRIIVLSKRDLVPTWGIEVCTKDAACSALH